MSIKVIVFDIIGVIAGGGRKTVLRELAEQHYPFIRKWPIIDAGQEPWKRIRTDASFTEEQFWGEVIKSASLSESVSDLKLLIRKGMIIFPEIMQLAKNLKEKGYTLAILSNQAKPWFEELTSRFPVNEVFDRRLCVLSYETGYAKPSIEAFEQLNRRLRNYISNVKPQECILIDDKIENLRHAADLGYITILFNAHKDKVDDLISTLSDLGILITGTQGFEP